VGVEELELEWAQTKEKKCQESERAKEGAAQSKHEEVEAEQNDRATEAYLSWLQKLMDELAERPAAAAIKPGWTVERPTVARLGTKRTVIANFARICQQLNREPEHVLSFFATELDAQCSEQPEGRLVLKGRWRSKQLSSLQPKPDASLRTFTSIHLFATLLT